MATTSSEAVNLLYQHIKASELMLGDHKVSGGLYKLQRPIQSVKEDIVINALPLNREQLQEGLLNVNVYVPNLSLQLNGLTDNSQPNTARLTELTKIGSDVLNEIDGPGAEYSFILQQEVVFEDTNNQHYINFRLEFYSINI